MKPILPLLVLAFGMTSICSMAREFHISPTGNDAGDGSASHPLRSISGAALLAMPGDEIIVHAGTYREWINPARGGQSDARRIVYRAQCMERRCGKCEQGWKYPLHRGVVQGVAERLEQGEYWLPHRQEQHHLQLRTNRDLREHGCRFLYG